MPISIHPPRSPLVLILILLFLPFSVIGEEEARTLQVTTWDDHFEVFMEHQVIVLNRPTKFITHLTDLRQARPWIQPGVIFTMSQGNTVIDFPYQVPDRPGIYIPTLTFPAPGDWKMSLRFIIASETHSIPLGDFKVYESEKAIRPEELKESPEGISFLKEQQWRITFRCETVQESLARETIPVSGVIRERAGGRAEILLPFAGRLAPVNQKPFPRPGQRVEEGEALAILEAAYSPQERLDYQSAVLQLVNFENDLHLREADNLVALATAKADYDQALATFQRVQSLFKAETKSKRELEEAQFNLERAKVKWESAGSMKRILAEARGHLSRAFAERGEGKDSRAVTLEIKAPFSGILVDVPLVVGNFHPAESRFGTLLDLQNIQIEARLPFAQIDRARGIGSTTLAIRPGSGGEMIKIAVGAPRLGLEVESTTKTIPLFFSAVNLEGRFPIGLPVTLDLPIGEPTRGISIPNGAVVEEDGRPHVFVLRGGETFERRELRIAFRNGETTRVASGLAAGDRLVVEGGLYIKLAAASTNIPAHGHAH